MLSTLPTDAPAATSARTAGPTAPGLPQWAAQCRGVRPKLLVAATSPPASTSAAIVAATASPSAAVAAKCKGLCPPAPLRLTSAPAASAAYTAASRSYLLPCCTANSRDGCIGGGAAVRPAAIHAASRRGHITIGFESALHPSLPRRASCRQPTIRPISPAIAVPKVTSRCVVHAHCSCWRLLRPSHTSRPSPQMPCCKLWRHLLVLPRRARDRPAMRPGGPS